MVVNMMVVVGKVARLFVSDHNCGPKIKFMKDVVPVVHEVDAFV